MNYPGQVFIPIGNDCSVAYNLSQLGKRQFALPFDWIRLNNIAQVIQLLENDFDDFLALEYLKVKRTVTGFPLLEDDWIDLPSDTSGDNGVERPEIVNSKYNISFLHDFYSDNFAEELSSIKEKYVRRIDRLREILKNDDITKIFVRGTLKKKIPREEDLLNECLQRMGIQNFELRFIDFGDFGAESGSSGVEIPTKDRWKRGPVERWKMYF